MNNRLYMCQMNKFSVCLWNTWKKGIIKVHVMNGKLMPKVKKKFA